MKNKYKIICYASFVVASYLFYCLVAFGTFNLAKLIFRNELLTGFIGTMLGFIICFPICIFLFYKLEEELHAQKCLKTKMPEKPTDEEVAEVNDFLIRLRLDK